MIRRSNKTPHLDTWKKGMLNEIEATFSDIAISEFPSFLAGEGVGWVEFDYLQHHFLNQFRILPF